MKYLIIYILLIANLTVAAQTGGALLNVTQRLATYTTNHPTEKAYLQFDKPYYAVGDTIYFKGYVTIGAAHKLSAMSGILHVDLIGPNNKLLNNLNLLIAAGTANGDIALADSLKGGTYRVRAYTNWMRNAGDDSFFEQEIRIGAVQVNTTSAKNGSNVKPRSNNQPPQKAAIQFMPEGGSLVNGNYSKIGFKAIAPNGKGIAVSGTVIDNTGTTVTTFTSAHLGMGSFLMVPQSGKTYSANVTYADGATGTIPLPQATNKGYTINLNNMQTDTLRIRISGGAESPLNQVSLVAHAGGQLFYASENHAENKFFTAMIPKNKFPTGIVQFTLFSATGEPLAERLAFINNHDELNIAANPDKQSYSPRQNVKIALDIKDKGNQAATGSFSVSVTDESKVQPDTVNEQSIFSGLLLTPDLKGTVEQPAYYFTNKDEKTITDLDNLLLTQGYRHFEWKQVLQNVPSKNLYEAERAITISGTVKRYNKAAAGAKVTLFSKTGGAFMLDTLTDNNGRFMFKDLVFADSTKFVVQSRVAKGQDAVTLTLDTLMPPTISKRDIAATDTETEMANLSAYVNSAKQFFQEQQKYGINKHAIALREVTIKDRQMDKVIPHSANLNGSGNANQVLTAKDLAKFTCSKITDCLAGVLTGVIIEKGKLLNLRANKSQMEVIIDGNYADYTDFEFLDIQDIEGIEVIMGPGYGAIYGSRMANGGIIVTTKRAKNANGYYRYAPGVITYMPLGVYKAREFYTPRYDNPQTNTNMPDLRSTIFWEPNIITDKDGKASFSYFNADGKGTYRVVIEGIDTDGNPGRQVVKYTVE